LKELLQCDRLVVFGDGKNDMDMFRIADECYAVENAVEELKEIATAVIGSNMVDGVANWLLEHAK
jgi:hydroxymethylpyrimidine pyrophosphatase-like HAD family hydrolase